MKAISAIALILTSACPAGANVVFTQPPDPAGGMIKSAWYAPDGMDGDSWAYDSFQLATTQSFNRISWRGGYSNYLSGAGKSPVYDFTISIHGSMAANTQPDVINPPLAEFQVGTNAGETPVGTFGGTQMYEYQYSLPTAFEAQAGTKYWVQIEAWQGLTPTYFWPPDWSIAYAAPGAGNGSHFQATKGSTKALIFHTLSRDLAFTLSSVVPVVNAIWTHDGNGDWLEGGNWNNGVAPNGTDHSATFGAAITAPRAVTVNAPCSVGTINFSGAVSYLLSGTSTLSLDATSQAGINVTAGSHTIAAPLALNQDATFNIAPFFSTLTISGPLAATGRNLSVVGQGTVQLENLRAASLDISSGTVRIRAKGTPNDASGTSVVQSLAIAPAGSLDLEDNALVIDYVSAGTLEDELRQQLLDYRLYSELADGVRQLGYADNAALGLTNFAGQSVDATSLLVKFTYVGDTNLDGQVDITDLGNLATNWQAGGVWTAGDFDFSGFIDITDLGMLATNWQAGVGTPMAGSFVDALAALGLAGTSVPEPALAGGLVLLAGMIRSRKR